MKPSMIWKEKIRHLVSAIVNNATSHREVQNASRLIQTDHSERFAVELVQNANDQAVRAAASPDKVKPTCVRITWRNGLLAVLNQGRQFDDRGLRAITSLALSDKKQAELIGNKGVGFKAVYEVCDEPRIYSGALRFSVPTRFSEAQHTQLSKVAREVLKEPASLALGSKDAAFKVLMSELLASPPFYYPRALSDEDESGDLASLGLEGWEDFTTAVVLQLRDGVDDKVERALQRLLTPGTLLFLPGVHHLTIQWGQAEHTLKRRSVGHLADDIEVIGVSVDTEEKRFWRLGGVVRTPELAEAAKAMDLESWKDIDQAPVAIALPIPHDEHPLGASGRFCMGLPTDQATGLPLWVDGRFHGTLNRDGLDLTTVYNKEVLSGVRSLFTRLLAYLRSSDEISLRRAATLALERGEGALAADPEWGEKTILCADNVFRSPNDVWLPKVRLFEKPNGETTSMPFDLLRRFRSDKDCLPELMLLEHGEGLLRGLGVEEENDEEWLKRLGGSSPLEQGAQYLREERGDWNTFLEWIVATFGRDELKDQKFLPVVGGVAAPEQTVYLPYLDRKEPLHPLVAQRLLFLDDEVVAVHEGRRVTDLAEQLAWREKLVRRPRFYELLKQGLAPAMVDSNEPTRWQLLALAIRWIVKLKQERRSKAADLPVLLPVAGEWLVAQRCYLGVGWGKQRPDWHEIALEQAYARQRLRPWRQVVDAFSDADAGLWGEAMEILDVGDLPRIEELKLKGYPFRNSGARLYRSRSFEPDLAGGKGELFEKYLDWVTKHVESGWSQSRDHLFSAVHWVDGLDREDARQTIAELILGYPVDYPVTTRVFHGKRSRDACNFWLHILRTHTVTFDGRSANTVWYVHESEADRRWTRLVHKVSERVMVSPVLLRSLGVYSIDKAPTHRLVNGLHQLAELIANKPEMQRDQRALSLAVELWTRLSARLEQSGIDGLGYLGSKALPLRLRHNLVPRLLDKDAFILVEDDKERARWLQEQPGRHSLPFKREPPKVFIDRLQKVLGPERVRRSSEREVDPGFTPMSSRTNLLEALGTLNDGDIELELAAVLTFTLSRPTLKVPSEAFTDLAGVEVQHGSFEGGESGFYDRKTKLLMVGRSVAILEELWRVVGEGSRHILGAFARARAEGRGDWFLEQENIGPAELNELEEEMGRAGYDNHAPLFVVAKWYMQPEGIGLDDVVKEWQHPRREEQLCEWLGTAKLPNWVNTLMRRGEADGILEALVAVGANVNDWQRARQLLGKPKHVFAVTLRRWKEKREVMVAQIRAEVAMDWQSDLDKTEPNLQHLAATECPDDLRYENPNKASVDGGLFASVTRLGLPSPSMSTKGWVHYRNYGDVERGIHAESAIRLRLAEAKALCPDQDDALVLADARLVALTTVGPWAHWRIALRRLGVILRERKWPCYPDMQRRNAFINRPKEAPHPPEPEPEIDDLNNGQEHTEEELEPVDSPHPGGERIPPLPKPEGGDGGGGSGGRGSSGGGGGRGSEKTRQNTGDRGERFFFDALRSWFQQQGLEFDDSCWVSKARRRFGFPDGDDELGYDFRVRDPGRPEGGGRLDEPGVLCHVEVKTTSSRQPSFPMSEGEWAHATACHRGEGEATYVLVRVHMDEDQLRIVDVVPDPVGAHARGKIQRSPKDYWVNLGTRVEPDDGTHEGEILP